MASSSDTQDERNALFSFLEREDRDRSLSLPFVPADRRTALAALYAFNAETARIRDLVSQPMPGEIRLQWWRDLIASGASGGSGHPTGDALLETISHYDLPRSAFDRFLEARIFDLYDDPMSSRTAFEAYAGETQSTLIMLAAMVLSRPDAGQISDAAGHAGVAQTVGAVIRALPLHRRRGQIYVPADILSASGCMPEAFLKAEPEPASRALAALIAFGRDHDTRWRERVAAVPKALRPAFLPATLSSGIFQAAEKVGIGAFSEPITIGPLRKSWRYWRAMRG
ncbi:MAG: phytoene/squalene synthase family protein [Fulvimarina manganoxydans]|uniref:phytoene/squalene synthase family protein n=1 Tax=Fulvimarina manganoxydans TaxID=937218 RepID=UPI002357D0EE|nr:phytoene/squalene synthase family protein [Fulvimarina manganoxydans]MCK5933142.1 phytoene/squalene synthase family protein [Fulvimarina manganoxydans]